MTIFPNLLMNDLASTHLRTYRPLAVDRMETMIWCIAPAGEPPDLRAARLRKFEDFFLPSGMATPDDIAICEAAQRAAVATGARWTEMGRGSDPAFRADGPDEAAKALGFKPKVSSTSPDARQPTASAKVMSSISAACGRGGEPTGPRARARQELRRASFLL